MTTTVRMQPSRASSRGFSLVFNCTKLRILYHSSNIVTAIRMIDKVVNIKEAPPAVGCTLGRLAGTRVIATANTPSTMFSRLADSLGVPRMDAISQVGQDYCDPRPAPAV